jgi:hypothetical protein
MPRKKAKYMIIYKCNDCGQDSGYTELDSPKCRFCKKTSMIVVSKNEITPEVIAARLKTTTDNMIKNLESAFEQLTTMDDKVFGDDKDAQTEFLKLMAKAQKLRDGVQGLHLKDPSAQDNDKVNGPGK